MTTNYHTAIATGAAANAATINGPLGQLDQALTNHVAAAVDLPEGHLFGLTLSNNATDPTNDIDIAIGRSRDATNTQNLVLSSALTKRLDAAWAVGTNQGGLDTGAVGNNTYHIWLIKRSDTGVVDVLFSLSASAPTMPANYDYKRRIGSIVRTGGAIKAFVQDGDMFTWITPVTDVNVSNPGTSAVTRTLTVPTGIRLKARLHLFSGGHASLVTRFYASDLSQTDSTPTNGTTSLVASALAYSAGFFEIMTNTSSQIRTRITASDGTTVQEIGTFGWIDTRGRLS